MEKRHFFWMAHYKSHAALDNMMSVSDYGLSRAVVYTASNKVEDGPVACFPIYALMFLEHDSLPEGAVYKLEL